MLYNIGCKATDLERPSTDLGAKKTQRCLVSDGFLVGRLWKKQSFILLRIFYLDLSGGPLNRRT